MRTPQKIKIANFIVVALDDNLHRRLQALGIGSYRYKKEGVDDARGNHGVSAMKFPILREFIEVGCSVLLTDTDVVYFQNPFVGNLIRRDSDVEGMSDGWDLASLHGYADAVFDLKSIGGELEKNFSLRIGCLNSGLWYISATHASYRLMKIMQYRLATETLWDQTGYNLELTLGSRDSHVVSGATMRVMLPFCFMNSKVYYRIMRQKEWFKSFLPVALHMNYHTDKMQKMKQVIEFYHEIEDQRERLKNSGNSGAEISVNAVSLPPCNGDGCLDGTKSLTELEAAAVHSINDSLVSGRNFRSAREVSFLSFTSITQGRVH